MRRALLGLMTVPALLVAGCGGEDPGAPAAAANCPQPCVTMRDTQFVPRDVTVRPGQTVTWANADSVVHDVVNAREGEEPRSQLFGEGGTYRFTARRPGRIDYVCTVHPGMTGTLTVR